jgi:hypothetical protein
VSWRVYNFDEEEAAKYARMLKIDKHFVVPNGDILSIILNNEATKINSHVVKKIAVLRILIRKPKIIIMKDTDEYSESIYLT